MKANIKEFIEVIDDEEILKNQYYLNPNIEKMVDAYNTIAVRNGRMELIDSDEPGKKAKELVNLLYTKDIVAVNNKFYEFIYHKKRFDLKDFLLKVTAGFFFLVVSISIFLVVRYLIKTDINPKDSMLDTIMMNLIEFFKIVISM